MPILPPTATVVGVEAGLTLGDPPTSPRDLGLLQRTGDGAHRAAGAGDRPRARTR